MCAKYQSSARFSVRAPEALTALGRWVEEVGDRVKERGRQYFVEGRVRSGWAEADHFVEADVEGESPYRVTLFLTRGKWRSSCTCPVKLDCKHAVAAALAWIGSEGADFDHTASQTPKTAPPEDEEETPPRPARYAPERRQTFREEWAPKLAEKLGRPLTENENQKLTQLSALFNEFTNVRFVIQPDALRRHGFGDAIPPATPAWGPVFQGWWTATTAPADPWALWQYLAYSLELNGRPIPEVFQPLTNTVLVGTSMQSLRTREQIQAWRQAVSIRATPADRPANQLQDGVAQIRARISDDGRLFIETQSAPEKPWKAPSPKWSSALLNARPSDFEALPPAEGALALTLAITHRSGFLPGALRHSVSIDVATAILGSATARPAIVLPDGRPFAIEPDALVPEANTSPAGDALTVRLVTPDGTDASSARLIAKEPEPLYVYDRRVWHGPPPLPTTALPIEALDDAHLMTRLRGVGLRLAPAVERSRRVVVLRPKLRLWLADASDVFLPQYFCAQLMAQSEDPPCEQTWCGPGGWQWSKGGAPPPRRPSDPLLEFDLSAADTVAARFADFRLRWNEWHQACIRPTTGSFPEEVLAWHATLPPGLAIDASSEIAGFFGEPLHGHLDFAAVPADSARDWFDLTVALRVEDTTLSNEEVGLLLKARGKWVRLAKHGWRRLEVAGLEPGNAAAATLDRLGLTAEDVFASGKPATHRMHALQLASEAAALEQRDAKLAASLRERVATLTALPPPPLPAGLTATLRPYQQDGFRFLAHLSAHGFGGVLADDMGLGKTVQALAWLLHLEAQPRSRKSPFRALVVCPKSVTHGWLSETARFTPGLKAEIFTPATMAVRGRQRTAQLLIANYTQLRLNDTWFREQTWDAVILDEAQFIKNPTSQVATAARALPSTHRVILTGTPVENRLTDLWSLFAFAQPGLLGPQSAFRRHYDEKDPAALSRLHRRVHHFLLRRTKAEAAPDLPPRTEDDLTVDLEPAQRKLYDAELKRARQQLLGIETDRALDQVRFNILASLLRLRQICCHPGLVDPAHASLPSAKLDALLEQVEELRDEGHQVLVFSQFVEMLQLIRARLEGAGVGYLMLTGATENRAELVEQFQSDRSKTVFLLSLKAAGFGLNLTAASYVILYDPWWNPAVEAQAIDRTHRIGQTRPVIAYRLLASNTIEEKIRLLQQEKAALAAAVVQEESLTRVLDLESLRRILT